MTTSFVHIGDFHAAPGPRNADRYRALVQILKAGFALPDLGAWLWPGAGLGGRVALAAVSAGYLVSCRQITLEARSLAAAAEPVRPPAP